MLRDCYVIAALAGGVRAPAPIVSRIFQEMSNGALAFNTAARIVMRFLLVVGGVRMGME